MAEKDRRCQIPMMGGVPCGRELYNEERCIFHSQKSNKDVELFQRTLDEMFNDKSLVVCDFSRFIFPKGVLFPKEINSYIFFIEVTFQDRVNFSRTIFQKYTQFEDTVFKEESLFEGTIFQDVTSFARSTFQDFANFKGTTFKGDTDFFLTVFQKHALFKLAVFKGKSNFENVNFQNIVDFENAIFEDALMIKEDIHDKIFSKDEVDFTYVGFLKPEKVSFRKVDLSKFRFLGTDLRKVEFVDVNWDRKRGRNRIYDEIEPDTVTEKFDYPLIAQVYKRLRGNYQENLNYAEAGDFHIGEMEMRRKGEKNPFNKGIIQLYKLLSNYGESYWRPLAWILLFLFLFFPILFMYSGIEPVAQSQTSYVINYDLDASSISLNKEKVADYLKSFVYSLSVFSLVREKQYRPIDNCGHLWMVLESILSPVLIAFFLLALRRRFRR